MKENVADKLSDIYYAIDQISSDLGDLEVLYGVERELKILNQVIENNNKIQSAQNCIMIWLTIAILYLTYVMVSGDKF